MHYDKISDTICYDMICDDTTSYDTISDTIPYDMIWCDTIRYGTISDSLPDMICYDLL